MPPLRLNANPVAGQARRATANGPWISIRDWRDWEKRGNPSPVVATVLVESVKGDSIPLRAAVVAAGFKVRSWEE
jgi:hypothetical protein